MEEHIVKILGIEKVTHDVNKLTVEKPKGYSFNPGQATEVAINKINYRDKKRPFTFTGLNEWENLEFTIKIYNDHNDVTEEIGKLRPGEELIIHDVWGAISYKGPGVFIAAGAGVTPFIAIFRNLKLKNDLKKNKLYFSNKTSDDIILKNELFELLGDNFINLLTREKNSKYHFGRINESFLKEQIFDFNQNFYICGPDKFVQDINSILEILGAKPDSVVFES
ncbi:MAG: flavodoxin reductase [Melioribacter sp.]|nr:flavodoxin reductase [Melioribacter sp.]